MQTGQLHTLCAHVDRNITVCW